MKKTGRNSRIIGYVARNIAVMILAVVCLWLPNRVRSSDEGLSQAELFVKLGIIDECSGEYLASYASAGECTDAILTLLGCGDPMEATEFFRETGLKKAPVFYMENSGASIEEEQTVRMATFYAMCLRAQGYIEGSLTYSGSEISKMAKEVGYGFLTAESGALNSASLVTHGRMVKILYEMLMTKVSGGEPVYRILGRINSDFLAKMIENGLYEEIPEQYAPRYGSGIYNINTFYSLEQTDGRMEWSADYIQTNAQEAKAFCTGLTEQGWAVEGEYYFEENYTVLTLLVKPHPEKPGMELGLVVRYSPELLTNPNPDPVVDDEQVYLEGSSGTVTWCLIEGNP